MESLGKVLAFVPEKIRTKQSKAITEYRFMQVRYRFLIVHGTNRQLIEDLTLIAPYKNKEGLIHEYGQKYNYMSMPADITLQILSF